MVLHNPLRPASNKPNKCFIIQKTGQNWFSLNQYVPAERPTIMAFNNAKAINPVLDDDYQYLQYEIKLHVYYFML